MWDRLRKQVEVERDRLNRLLETHRPLLKKCVNSPPDEIELSALGAMLHSFYTGIENLLKRIALELDGTLPGGEFWHRELLDAMTRATDYRPRAISAALRERLREYLEFRHVFRQAYAFQLNWYKMRSLVLGCEQTLRLLEGELDRFLEREPETG